MPPTLAIDAPRTETTASSPREALRDRSTAIGRGGVRLLTGSLSWGLHVGAAAVCLTFDSPLLGIAAYPLVLVLFAGLIGWTARQHIRPGRFERDPLHPTYRGRMVYGAAWTAIFYCKPLLHLVLSCAPLKWMTFRLFGYRGSLDFTTYADTWMRDMAVLDLGPGTYVANRCTLGTNIVHGNRILVGSIRTGRDVVIGHLSMIGPGTVIGDRTALGQDTAVGRSVRIGSDVVINGRSSIDHGARIHDRVVLGGSVTVGKRAVIHPGVRVPAGTLIPDRAVIRSADDLQGIPRVA